MRGEGCLPALTSPCLRPLLCAANPAAGVYFGAGVRASPRGDGGWDPSLVVCFGPFSQLGRWGAARTWGVRAVRAVAGCPKVPPVPAEGMGQRLWCCSWVAPGKAGDLPTRAPQVWQHFYGVFGASLPKISCCKGAARLLVSAPSDNRPRSSWKIPGVHVPSFSWGLGPPQWVIDKWRIPNRWHQAG